VLKRFRQAEQVVQRGERENNEYLEEMKLLHCNCDDCDEVYYANKKRHVATMRLDILKQPTMPLGWPSWPRQKKDAEQERTIFYQPTTRNSASR